MGMGIQLESLGMGEQLIDRGILNRNGDNLDGMGVNHMFSWEFVLVNGCNVMLEN